MDEGGDHGKFLMNVSSNSNYFKTVFNENFIPSGEFFLNKNFV